MTSRSHWPLMSSSAGRCVTYKPSNSSLRANSFSRLNTTKGTWKTTRSVRGADIYSHGIFLERPYQKEKKHIMMLNNQHYLSKLMFMLHWSPAAFQIAYLHTWDCVVNTHVFILKRRISRTWMMLLFNRVWTWNTSCIQWITWKGAGLN